MAKGGLTIVFSPDMPPAGEEAGYAYRMFQRLAAWFRQPIVSEIQLQERFSEPSKPVRGMMVYADGTNWNPHSGAGPYIYNGTVWVYLYDGSTT